MKVHFKRAMDGYSGKSDDAVYYYHPRLNLCLVRDYVIPKESTATVRFKAVMANLKQIQPSEGYKRNLKDYLLQYNQLKDYQHKPMLTWNNLYVKLMFAMEKALPGVDLTTLTRQQIEQDVLPCRSVKAAVEAGLLPVVEGYARYHVLI
jgi:hypothetical protein